MCCGAAAVPINQYPQYLGLKKVKLYWHQEKKNSWPDGIPAFLVEECVGVFAKPFK